MCSSTDEEEEEEEEAFGVVLVMDFAVGRAMSGENA
jgi:hypothetical protein